MSEHVTHLAVAEDSARLASVDKNFSKRMLKCIQEYPQALRLGSTTRSGDKFIIPLIAKWRDDWKKKDPRSEKMAYLLGWSGHLAADRIFKPVYRMTNLNYYLRKLPSPSNASVYHDAVTFGEVYQHGRVVPFHPSILRQDLYGHPAADLVPVSRIEKAFAGNFAAYTATLKTFFPANSEEMTDKWSDLETERQSFYVDLERYTEAYYHGNPQLLKQLIIDPNFYNEDDPIIRLARSVQNGEQVNVSLEEALEAAENQSLYAQAIKLGHQFLMADSDFFEGKISMDEAEKRHRRGQRHKQKLKYYIELAKQKETGN